MGGGCKRGGEGFTAGISAPTTFSPDLLRFISFHLFYYYFILLKNIPEFHTQISFLSFFTTSESNGSLLHLKVKVLILRHCNTICVTESAKSVKVFLEASWLHLCVVILKLNESSEIDVITDDDPKQNLMFGVKQNNFSGGF